MWGMISLMSLVEIPSGPWLHLLCIPPQEFEHQCLNITLQESEDICRVAGGKVLLKRLRIDIIKFPGKFRTHPGKKLI